MFRLHFQPHDNNCEWDFFEKIQLTESLLNKNAFLGSLLFVKGIRDKSNVAIGTFALVRCCYTEGLFCISTSQNRNYFFTAVYMSR